MMVRLVLVLILTCLHFGAVAEAEKRVALVIGNADYEHESKLRNPINDATKLKEALERLNFAVTFKTDLDYSGLRQTLGEFSEKTAGADLALIYFSGHGIEVGGNNYLIPTDAKLSHARQVDYQAIPFYQVTNAVEGVSKLSIIILDACRDNPFRTKMVSTAGTKSIGKGLARVSEVANTLVAYAAKEGTVALDGKGENSPYLLGLLKHIEQPNLEVGLMFRRVRDEVWELTGGKQQPFIYGSISGQEVYLGTKKEEKKDPTPPAPPVGPISQAEETLWNAIKGSKSKSDFEFFLSKFPKGRYAAVAELRLKQLAIVTPPSPPKDKKPVDPVVGVFPEKPPKKTEPEKLSDRVERQAKTVEIGKWPEGLTYSDGLIWAAISGERAIASYNPKTGRKLGRAKVGRLPVQMAVSEKDVAFALVHTSKALWRRNPRDKKFKRFRGLSGCPQDMVLDGSNLWIMVQPECHSGSFHFVRVSLPRGTTKKTRVYTKEVDFKGNNRGFTAAHGKLYITFGSGEILLINQSDFAVFKRLETGQFLLNATAHNLGVFVAGRGGNQGIIFKVDPKTNEVTKSAKLTEAVLSLTASEKYILAAGANGAIYVLSPQNLRLVRTLVTQVPLKSPRAILPVGDKLYLTSGLGHNNRGFLVIVDRWRP